MNPRTIDASGPCVSEVELLARYWGKAEPSLGGHHTVLSHSLDVAATAFVLVEHHPVLRQRFASASALTPAAAASTIAALCAMHDLGKVDTRFQRKAPAVADRLRPRSVGLPGKPYDHGVEGFRLADDPGELRALLETALGPEAATLLRAVCGHHGSLPTCDEPAPRTSVLLTLRQEDHAARLALVRVATDLFRNLGASLPWPGEVNPVLVQLLAGLCSVADWVGSDVEFFPYSADVVEPSTYWSTAVEQALRACAAAGLLRAAPRDVSFGELFPGYEPRDVQLITESLSLVEPALVIVEAAMGTGKTEAALGLSSRMLSHGLADGVTVALPTMATSNAMFARVEAVTDRLFSGSDVQLALAHSKASREPRFNRLKQRSLRAYDADAPEASVMCARWLLSRKRILLAQVGVGTIDQALQAALVVRHQFVRLFALARNVVVIDEVHAYDAYMEVLLEHLLRWLGAMQVPVILLSATLPSERRQALAHAWQGKDGDEANLEDQAEASSRPYPLVTVARRSGVTEAHAMANAAHAAAPMTRAFALKMDRRPTDDSDMTGIIDRLIEAARGGARVVWIRSTVRLAQAAFRKLLARGEGVECVLFHARFRGCDRRAVETGVLSRFGKSAAPGGRVLIATQVVEQSLDLDFDELHTDLAPIDLVFQRAGRLHRHERTRPSGFEEPRLVVHAPLEAEVAELRFGPARFVYDVATLWLANRVLSERDSLRLPDDIRPLVERSYHPAARRNELALGGADLVSAELKRNDQLIGKRVKARQCCIPPTSADADGGATLADDDDAVQAFTRDGLSATLLPLWWDGEDARALDAEMNDAPWDLDSASPHAWRLASTLADQTLNIPSRAEVKGVLATGEAATWERWAERFARFANDSGLGRRVVPVPFKRTGELHKGWLRLGESRRRVLYSKRLGLSMPSERDETEER